MVLGIAPVAIIYRQLPVEYTITSRSTDVVAYIKMATRQNIKPYRLQSMFEREKLSRNNFNEWFHQLKLVLRVEKKMFVIKQPLPVAPAANSEAQVLSQWNAVYDTYNEVACLILGKSETRILNMAPTKKVDKTPYELWYGKVPNLSYLKKKYASFKDPIMVLSKHQEAVNKRFYEDNKRFETDRDDTKSQTRYDFILNGSAVDWKSSKQSTTAMSATESKYIAASKAAMEAA
ncbi:hypothetical protein Tco_1142771 [Tanacetum coccineum]